MTEGILTDKAKWQRHHEPLGEEQTFCAGKLKHVLSGQIWLECVHNKHLDRESVLHTVKTFSALACLVLALVSVEAKSRDLAPVDTKCQNMAGTYSVIPFTQPADLQDVGAYYGFGDPFGQPVFKVAKNDGKWAHVGLVHGNRYPIQLSTQAQLGTEWPNRVFMPKQLQCAYKLDEQIYVVAVDLSKTPPKELDAWANYIGRSWGSALIDYIPKRSESADEQNDQAAAAGSAKLVLNAEAVRSVHYFLLEHVELTGVIEYVVMVPLRKQ